MAEIRLTKDAEYMLCELYSAYLKRRKDGECSEDARCFGSSETIQETYIPKWSISDIDTAARELSRKGFITCLFADNTLYAACTLTDDAIAFMEHRFSDKIDGLIQRIATLRTIIFG